MTPAKFANALERRLGRLDPPKGFFTAERGGEYREVIVRVSRPFLLRQAPPEGVDVDEWERLVERFLDGIQVRVRSNGFRFYFHGVAVADERGGLVSDITLEDIKAWIDAGAQGDPLGKRLEVEDKREAAFRIYTSIYGGRRSDGSRGVPSAQPRHVRLREHIERFLERSPYSLARFFPALRSLWRTALRQRYSKDFYSWARKAIR